MKKRKVKWPTLFEPWFRFGTALGDVFLVYFMYFPRFVPEIPCSDRIRGQTPNIDTVDPN